MGAHKARKSDKRGMIVRNRSLLLLLGTWFFSMPLWSQQRPLRTDDAEIIGVGNVRAEFGVEFLQNQRFSLSGLQGDLSRLGVASLHFGMGEYAEIQISGVMQDFLSVSQHSPNPPVPSAVTGSYTSDYGNLILASKARLLSEKGIRPAMAFKFAVELPNAKPESGLGKSETNFYASLLLSKHLRSAELMGNIGLGILGSPVEVRRQADPLIYGVAIICPVHKNINLVGEINGRQGPIRLGNENQLQARAGLQIRTRALRWDVAGIAGFKEFDPDSGIAFGITYQFKVFHK
jgi:hypothetical protein